MKKIFPVLFIFSLSIVFSWQFFTNGLLPIPSDTIIGLYHPFRDLYSENYPNGIPFKNFLITDPVRQIYPWKELAVSVMKNFELPLWNPYSFSGTPLLANFQSGVFYIFNFLYFILPFSIAWSYIVLLGPLLTGLLMFFYLDNLKLNKWASLIGATTITFSGFFVAWMEWGSIIHTTLWLPLILLSVDKIFFQLKENSKIQFKFKNYCWPLIFIFSLTSSFFAGHLQTFFYLFVFSWIYFLSRWIQFGFQKRLLILFIIINSLFIILAAIQWIPTLQFILLSARNVDQAGFNSEGWLIPWQHAIQFVAPDFFGNPTTLNYWGVWNYGELVGYVGVLPLILAVFSMFFRRDKKTLFFGSLFFISILFSFPTLLAKLPYLLNIPYIATAQPTRLLFITNFSLAILCALGFDYLFKTKNKTAIIYPLTFASIALGCLWVFIPNEHMQVVRSNLLLPTFLLVFSWILMIALIAFQKKRSTSMIICIIIVGVVSFDLLRFGWKFTPFTDKSYLFPETLAIKFLQENLGEHRIMSTDSRILPPNFSTIYRVQSLDGYDPLYLLRYGELIAASQRQKPDIRPPFGFNRIITPQNYDSEIIDLLGVKYVLSLSEITSPKLTKVFQEGQTFVYENKQVLPRAFFVKELRWAVNKEVAINMMFQENFDPLRIAIVENIKFDIESFAVGKVSISYYSENKVIIETDNEGIGFLILTDSYYPTWKVRIDSALDKIYKTDYNFRGIIVPSGKHKIEFYNSLF